MLKFRKSRILNKKRKYPIKILTEYERKVYEQNYDIHNHGLRILFGLKSSKKLHTKLIKIKKNMTMAQNYKKLF